MSPKINSLQQEYTLSTQLLSEAMEDEAEGQKTPRRAGTRTIQTSCAEHDRAAKLQRSAVRDVNMGLTTTPQWYRWDLACPDDEGLAVNSNSPLVVNHRFFRINGRPEGFLNLFEVFSLQHRNLAQRMNSLPKCRL